MSSYDINQLFQDAKDYDPDKRFMAANDLCAELLKENSDLDTSIEKKICSTFLEMLDDANIDVQGNAVRCIKLIASKINEGQVAEVASKLGDCIISGKEEFRDIYTTCLQGFISDSSDNYWKIICDTLLPLLKRGLTQGTAQEESVDILTDLLRRFGQELHGQDHSQLTRTVQSLLTDDRDSVRKKATACLGAIAVVLGSKQLNTVVNALLQQIQSGGNKKLTFTFIQAICAISRTVGYRLSNYLPNIIPLLYPICSVANLNIENPDVDDDHELIEMSLTTFESFLKRCPRDITDYVQDIMQRVIELISYDPNYVYSQKVESDEEWSDSEGSFSQGDDDDSSWKVRRAAVRVIDAIIKSRPEMLAPFYTILVDKLCSRFVEREENVKLDIFSTFSSLLRSIIVGDTSQDADAMDMGMPSLVRMKSSAYELTEQVPMIISGILVELQAKSTKAREGVTALLVDMSMSLPKQLTEHLPQLIPEIIKSLQDKKNTSIRLQTLVMLKRIFRSGSRQDIFAEVAPSLLGEIKSAIGDDYFKIMSEGLRLAGNLIKGLNGAHIATLFPDILQRLSQKDIDQEVKQAAISSTAIALETAGSQINQSDVNAAIQHITDRLKSEVTRIPSLKAFTKISSGASQINFSIDGLLADLCNLLRQNSRAIKLATVEAVIAITTRYQLSAAQCTSSINELQEFINDSDLHLAQFSLEAIKIMADRFNIKVSADALGRMKNLARSQLLQGASLEKLCECYIALGRNMDYNTLANDLINDVNTVSKQGLNGLSRCAAVLINNSKTTNNFIKTFLGSMTNVRDEINTMFAALCVGEIGRIVDLSGQSNITDALIGLFNQRSEDIKTSASLGLGNLAVGNLQVYLPIILQRFQIQEHRYLLLIALKQVISSHFNVMQPYIQTLLPLLFEHCESPEEGVRNLVAECLGKLFMASYSDLIDPLETNLKARSPLTRATVSSALKFATTKNSDVEGISLILDEFLTTLSDQDINVKKCSLLSLNALVHNLPQLIRSHVVNFIGLVYNETKLKTELIQEVDLGAFTHKVDDGLPLRKAAYELIDTLLDNIPDKVEPNALAENLIQGLEDMSDEVQMICHQVLSKLSDWAGGAVLGALDAIVDSLQKAVNKQIKLLNNRQEVEKASSMLRSVIRAIDRISRISDVDTNIKFHEFMESIASNEHVKPMLEHLAQQRESIFHH